MVGITGLAATLKNRKTVAQQFQPYDREREKQAAEANNKILEHLEKLEKNVNHIEEENRNLKVALNLAPTKNSKKRKNN